MPAHIKLRIEMAGLHYVILPWIRLTDVIKLPCIEDSIVLSSSISALDMSSPGRYSLTASDIPILSETTNADKTRSCTVVCPFMMHNSVKKTILSLPILNIM